MRPTLKVTNEARYLGVLRRYAREVEKDCEYVLARTSLNLVIKAAQATRVAAEYPIKLLFQNRWWKKFVAKVAARKKRTQKTVTKTYLRVENGNPRRMRIKYSRAMTAIQRGKLLSRRSISILKGRVGRVRYTKSGWFPSIEALKKEKLKLMVPAGAAARTTFPHTKDKKPGWFRFVRARFKSQVQIAHTSKLANSLARDAMNKAFATAATDMTQFLDSRLKETTRRYNNA